MKTEMTIRIVLLLVAFAAGIFVGDGLAQRRAQMAIAEARLNSQIQREEIERLAQKLRDIRTTAAEATVVEKAL